MVLWKKESTTSGNACFIDLLPPNQVDSFKFEQLKSTRESIKKNDSVSLEWYKDGNELFEAKNWTEAIEHYNESIRFAINGSELLALCYVERSTCFLQLKMYEKCLADIELAKNSNFPQHLMHQLDERKATCLKEMEESTEVDEKVTPELSFNQNTKFPCMADILEVRSNDEFGKHVVAKCDIDVGKVVLLEDAFTFVADNSCKMFCKTCAKESLNFIPCPNCVDVIFCNTKCMESNDLHKRVCGALYNRQHGLEFSTEIVESILTGVSAFPNAESLMKFVECALATRDLDSPECQSNSQAKYRLFLKLFALPQDINEVRQHIFNAYKLLLDIPHIGQCFHSMQAKRFLMHLIWQHICILTTNGFGVTQDESEALHMNLIWTYSSLFNHSCTPNTLHLIHGNKMIAFIMRPVKKGEQLFINYFQGNDIVNMRKRHNFECKCSKCIPCWQQEDRNRMQSDDNLLFIAQSHLCSEDFKDSKKRSIFKTKCQNWFTKFGRLPWTPEFEIMEWCYKACYVEELSAWDY